MSDWREWTLDELLVSHGLRGVEERLFPTDGWSGATFTSLERGGERFVLKRTSLATDWIARATNDVDLREAWVASDAQRPGSLTASLPVAYLGAAADGDGAAILTPDLSAELIAWDRPGHDATIDLSTLDRVVEAMALLHGASGHWGLASAIRRQDAPSPPMCPLPERLLLLSRPSAAAYAEAGNPVGDRFLAGWDAFDRHAPEAARDLLRGLSADPSSLVRALGTLPAVRLHGDLKLANVALFADGTSAFIDWQMVMHAPIAVELGWFLVSNSGSLPIAPDAVLDRYRDALAAVVDDAGGVADEVVGDWSAQDDLTLIVGLLLRGWRKGLDAEAGLTLPSGMTAAEDLGWWCARAVDAAERRL